MKTTKQSIMTSLVALLVLISMFVGTTFAWFTDIVTSKDNVIQAGMLDANMYWSEELLDADSDQWIDASAGPVFNHELWEPGYTQVRYVKVQNDGNLNFKWMLSLAADGKVTELSDVIDVYYIESPTAAIDSLDGLTSKGNLTDVLEGNISCEGSLKPDESCILAIAFHMDELAGNEYQGMTLCEAGFSLKRIATQATGEFDSFDDQYDANAEWPYVAINYSVAESVAEKIDTTGNLTEDVKIGEAGDLVSAEVPAGVKLAAGAEKLTLSVNSMETPKAEVTTTNRSEVLRSVDVHLDGLDLANNTVPVIVKLNALFPVGLNDNNVKLFHVENGVTKAMTLVANPVNHNEFSYDPLTGDTVIAVASFSEIAAYADTDAGWNGTSVSTKFSAGSGTEADPYIIANAADFVYFRNQVDAGETFDDKFIKINDNTDINLNGHNFDPIGWGYAYASHNREGAEGKVFMGTFDGNNNIIHGLYQNGWDLESSTGTDYTYTNCGGGLFASACDATIKNLTISNAQITYECVEIGVLVGLAQGNCKFENIDIYGCKIANYQRPAGGVVGEVSPAHNGTNWYGAHEFTNVTVDSNTVVGSLWGDFDTPVGGVIGARWDDDDVTTVKMTDCNVSCTLDVYNDVTSTYQWYAYRRAGMLIGNTDTPPADGKNSKVATANFLTCERVIVIYDDWANYHYCQFTNEQNTGRSWPWVRVEAGENCSPYSNPRYGQPNDAAGNKVQDALHTHKDGDKCLELIPFHQLYGGGQGVYGQANHAGVTEGLYTVSYMDNGEIIHIDYVEQGETPTLWDKTNIKNANGKNPLNWVDGTGATITAISNSARPTTPVVGTLYNPNYNDLILYPKWPGEFVIRFLDAEKNIIYYQIFTEGSGSLDTAAVEEARQALQKKVDASEEVIKITWDTDPSTIDLSKATGDIRVNAKYSLADSKMTLTPVYDEADNTTIIAYKLSDYDISSNEYDNIIIPERVGLIPVVSIENDVFAGYTNLVSVEIPETITSIGSNAFEDGATILGGRSTITIYFNGDSGLWKQYMDLFYKDKPYAYYTDYNTVGTYDNDDTTIFKDGWDSGLGDGSRIFFLGADGKVDLSKGYWELHNIGRKKNGDGWFDYGNIYVWVFHNHTYVNGSAHSGCNQKPSSNQYTDYVNDQLNNTARPDRDYWVNDDGTAITAQ